MHALEIENGIDQHFSAGLCVVTSDECSLRASKSSAGTSASTSTSTVVHVLSVWYAARLCLDLHWYSTAAE